MGPKFSAPSRLLELPPFELLDPKPHSLLRAEFGVVAPNDNSLVRPINTAIGVEGILVVSSPGVVGETADTAIIV